MRRLWNLAWGALSEDAELVGASASLAATFAGAVMSFCGHQSIGLTLILTIIGANLAVATYKIRPSIHVHLMFPGGDDRRDDGDEDDEPPTGPSPTTSKTPEQISEVIDSIKAPYPHIKVKEPESLSVPSAQRMIEKYWPSPHAHELDDRHEWRDK